MLGPQRLQYPDVRHHQGPEQLVADTPGCTAQACGVRDHNADYEAAGAKVIGVSPDPIEDVAKFADKYGLDFTLLADADHEVAEAYGTWIEKQRPTGRAVQAPAGSNYGRTYWGVQRATFIIDPDGKIAPVFPKVSPQTHDNIVLDALVELPAQA
ncbi:MAG: peroxiredoxin [Actinomycetota bacterium]|nr:peroxiredoxin [Actinomycetota bacterium]